MSAAVTNILWSSTWTQFLLRQLCNRNNRNYFFDENISKAGKCSDDWKILQHAMEWKAAANVGVEEVENETAC